MPTRLQSVCEALTGTTLEPAKVREATRAAAEGLEIMRDAHASEAYRRRVAAGLAERVLLRARDAALAVKPGVRA